MKAISARIRGATSELADMGEEYEDIAQGMSKYRDEIMALTNVTGRGGFDIMADVKAGEYKDLYDIFVGLAQVWDKLSGTAQARLSEILGGTRQLQVVSSIMNNIADATGAYGDAVNSAGSLTADYEKQLDSISGKLGVLKANFQELSASILDSNIIKYTVDGLSAITAGLTKVADKAGVTGIIGLAMAFVTLRKSITPAVLSIVGLKSAINSLSTGTKIGLLIDALLILNSVIKLITGNDIVGWFDEWTLSSSDKIEKLNEQIKETNDNIVKMAKDASDLSSKYEDITGRLFNMMAKVGDNDPREVLNVNEYEEFLNLQNEIAEMFPEIDLGIDSNGNHIIKLSGNVDSLRESYRKLYEAQLLSLRAEQLASYKAGQEAYDKEQELRKQQKAELEEQKRYYEAFKKSSPLAVGKIFAPQGLNIEGYKEFLDQLGVIYEEIGDGAYKIIDIDAVESNLDDLIYAVTKKLEVLDDTISSAAIARQSTFAKLLGTDIDYQELSTDLQNVVSQLVSNLDFESLGKQFAGDPNQLLSYIINSFVKPLADANVSQKIEEAISGDGDAKSLQTILETVYNSLDDFGKNAFISYMKAAGHAVDDFDDSLEALSQDLAKQSLGGAEDAFASMITGIVGVKTEYQELADIISKFDVEAAGGGLDKKQYEALTRILPDLTIEIRAYNEELKNGTSAAEANVRLLDRMKEAAKGYIDVRLADGFKKVAEAANKFGSDSYQAQHAMRELAEVSPDLIGLLYDTGSGLYDLGDAAEYSAESIRAFALIQIDAKIASIKADLASLSAQFGSTAMAAVTSAEIIARALAGSAPGGSTSGKGHRKKGPGQQGGGAVMHGSDLDDYYLKEDIAGLQADAAYFEDLRNRIANMDFTAPGGGGGGGKTEVEKLKDAFDVLNQSLENHIALQEEAFNKSQSLLNAAGMREALARQVGYYAEIQRQAKKAMESVKDYYKKQGLSDQAAEQKKEYQELSKDFVDATKQVEDAMDRMTKAIVEAFSKSVDAIQGVYDTLHNAADEFATTGYITVDTFQEIISHGVEYLAFLQDENGQLVINEDNIRKVIAARVEQMTVESALAYVEALQTAKASENEAALDRLLHATQGTTEATWGLVYASLGLVGLSGEEYDAALATINSLRALSDTAINSIGQGSEKVKDVLKDMQKGVNDLLKYVMDMIKKNVELQIEALEEQKKDFADIIKLKKESLELDKKELEHSEKVAEITKKLANLQSKIDALSLVGTRESEAEKQKLLEEQEELQKELGEVQSEYAYDMQQDSLDKMEEAYNEEKDYEIKKLKETISSKQKIYDQALEYIETHWATLKDELIKWNAEYGDALESDIVSAWEEALKAAQKYGSFTQSLGGLKTDIENVGQGGTSNLGPKPDYDTSSTDEENIRALVNKMKYNSKNWFAYTEEGRKQAAKENEQMAAMLGNYGVTAVRGDDGVWYIDRVGGERLYEKYASFHTGGIVGGGTPKADEQFALLKNKEWVLSEKMVGNLTHGMKVIGRLTDLAANMFAHQNMPAPVGVSIPSSDVLSNISNMDNRRVSVSIGNTTITGADKSTVAAHEKVTRGFIDELARQLGVKW